jgi:diguanylate cyclase (GGDEF)-like protein
MRAGNSTWLCPTDQDRARVRENSARVARARKLASGTVAIAVLFAARRYGWWLLLLMAASLIDTQSLDWRMRRSRVPEYHSAFTILTSQAWMSAAAALTGGPTSSALPLIAVPTAFAAARFRASVAWLATASAIGMLLIATLGLHAAATLAHPEEVTAMIALMIGVSAATHALRQAEVHHRVSAVLDPLTGLLNRQGLAPRFDELAEQAWMTGAPVSLLVCDLDHFKEVNDTHGHGMGDAVLRDVAYALRKQLRSFELIYRIGGEEFLVLLPGSTPDVAETIGERLCEAVRSCHPQGLPITLSVGVSTLWGADVNFERLFDAADHALYSAKTKGRDRVVVAPIATGPPDDAPAPAIGVFPQPISGTLRS